MRKLLLLLIVSLLLIITGCKKKSEARSERIVPVSVLEVKPDSITTYITVTGNLEALHDALVVSKVSERLVKIEKTVGSKVKADEVIARLDDRLLVQARNQARAALQSAKARYENVRQDFERYQRLFKEKAISQQQWDQIQAAMREAKANLQQVEAALNQANEQLQNSLIKAPFAGVIGTFYFDQGDMVGVGQPVAQIINPRLMRARLYVPDLYMNQLHVGQKVMARFPVLNDQTFYGRIVRTDRTIDPMSRTITVDAVFDNADQRLTSGLYGEFKIRLQTHKNTIVVPDNALLARTEVKIDPQTGKPNAHKQRYLFAVQGDSVKVINVRVGLVSEDRVEITSGLQFGDLVVIVGQRMIKDGQKVRIAHRY